MKKLQFLLLISLLFCFSSSYAQIYGCTDPLATNFNPNATSNDGSCLYANATIAPTTSVNLTGLLSETSGLIHWNNYLWTHNDNTDTHLYCLDTLNGSIAQPYLLNNINNIDWEEVSQDSSYVYIGDFGNNANGNRTDLKILRISKNSILQNNPVIDTIAFSYSNQVNFLPAGSNNTNFDCEAFIVSADSIYLFTKQWLNNQTSLYSLVKNPGTYVANYRSSLNVNGLITGATYLEAERLIVLSGYSTLLQPFMFLLYDFTGNHYFEGNKRKISVSLPFHQVEGVATRDGLKYYITNEHFYQPPVINIPQGLHTLSLDAYLGMYLLNSNTGMREDQENECFLVPDATGEGFLLYTGLRLLRATYRLTDLSGKTILAGRVKSTRTVIPLKEFPAGMYILNLRGKGNYSMKFMKN